MKTENFPLSGDVLQAFRFWSKFFSQQTGFININNVQSANPELEMDIIENGASYGRQLGILSEALEVILKKSPPQNLEPGEEQALKNFSCMTNKIQKIKEGKTKTVGDGKG